MEAMLLDNVASNASVQVQLDRLQVYLHTNAQRNPCGAGGANGTTPGAGEAGPVNAAATDGTLRPLTEALVNIADCWNAGATPTIVMCGPTKKAENFTFTGNATRYKDA